MKKILISSAIACFLTLQFSLANENNYVLTEKEMKECLRLIETLDKCAGFGIFYGHTDAICSAAVTKFFKNWKNWSRPEEIDFLKDACFRACSDTAEYAVKTRNHFFNCRYRHEVR